MWDAKSNSMAQLYLCMQSVKQAKVSNYLVVAIDTALRDQLETEGIPVYYRDVKVHPLPATLSLTAIVSCAPLGLAEHVQCRGLTGC